MADVDGGWPVVRRKKRPWLDRKGVGRRLTQRRAMRCGASKKLFPGAREARHHTDEASRMDVLHSDVHGKIRLIGLLAFARAKVPPLPNEWNEPPSTAKELVVLLAKFAPHELLLVADPIEEVIGRRGEASHGDERDGDADKCAHVDVEPVAGLGLGNEEQERVQGPFKDG